MRTPQSELERRRLNERGRQILLRKEGKAVRPQREDGYVNLLNKYGTQQDSSEAYRYEREPIIPDMQLTGLYEGNGLFAKIIDTPAEEALKHGFDLSLKNDELDAFVEDALDALEWEEKAATAIKWARLYGGSIIVMLIDDGRGLEEPVDWKHIRSIDELRVYERAVVQPDYSSLYMQDYGGRGVGNRVSKFGCPEFYYVSSIYGSFTVHESRCLLFRNGVLPELTTNTTYQLWGMPEYIRIQRALRETLTAHGDSVKLLERSVQAIYSMKNLAQLLATDDGENQVLKRLQVIDMARGLLNSIAIDSEGESYDFKVAQFSGVRDVIDASCNMLSSLTNIPQTLLFGRSPAGMNATGESDLENWYNFVERIQKLMLKPNLRNLLDVTFRAGVASGDIAEEPNYKLKFNPLWSLSETEQAAVDQTKAQTAQVKAQTAQIYVDMQAIDPQEVRHSLASDEDFDVEDIVSEDEGEDLLRALYGDDPPVMEDIEAAQKNEEQEQAPGGGEQSGASQLPPQPAPAKVDRQDDEDWITMKGTHVLVGQEGTISGGPQNLRGKTYKKRESSSDIPKQNTGAKYQREYSVVEKMAISDEMSAASYLMTACGVPFTEVKDYVDTGTAVENAKKVIEARRIETQKRFEACSEAQQKFMNMNPDEAKEFASECYLQEIDRSLNRGSHTQHMAQALGLNDKPKVVSREEFDKIAAQSPTGPVFRGVVDNLSAGVSADEIVDMTVSGEITFLGNGVHSDGIYFSTSRKTAEGYGGGDKGRVMEACFSSDARIVDYETLLSQKSSTPIGDTGTFALYSGYNAIRVKESGGEEYLIALDRSALVFCDSRGDSVTNGSDAVNGDELAKTFNAFAERQNTDDSVEQQGVGVLVIVGGKILCGTRVDDGTIGGPGGHIEAGETPEEAAIRETQEEFGITPKELIPITTLTGMPEEYCDSQVFLCTSYDGQILCNIVEMTKPGFLTIEKALDLMENKPGRLFLPFARSIVGLLSVL